MVWCGVVWCGVVCVRELLKIHKHRQHIEFSMKNWKQTTYIDIYLCAHFRPVSDDFSSTHVDRQWLSVFSLMRVAM